VQHVVTIQWTTTPQCQQKQNSAWSQLTDGKVPAVHLWWSHDGGR